MRVFALALVVLSLALPAGAELPTFQPADLFHLQWASQPEISPDGRRVVYVRNHVDVMADRYRQNLWLVDFDGSNHQPLTTGSENHAQPRWSPDGTRIAYVGNQDGSSQLYVRWVDSGREARLAQLTQSPSALAWSPDGTRIAFSQFVPDRPKPFVQMPQAPRGAQWADRAQYIDRLVYRRDGRGYLQPGRSQVFIVPAEGGAPLQVTHGDFDHGGPVSWTPDGRALVFSANRREDADFHPRRANLFVLDLASGELRTLFENEGPATQPQVSPDGRRVAFRGYEDRELAYQQDELYVINLDGTGLQRLAPELDRALGAVLMKAVALHGDHRVGMRQLGHALRILWVRNGQLYDKVGLRQGDVVLALNGMSTSDTDTIMAGLGTLLQQRDFTLDLLRNGRPVTLRLTVTE